MSEECGGVVANFNVRWVIKSSMTWSAELHRETGDLQIEFQGGRS